MSPRPSNEAQLASPSYRVPATDLDFLLSESQRGLRFQIEFEKAEEILRAHHIASTVVVFGSARVREDGPPRHAGWYADARAFGRLVSTEGGARFRFTDGRRENIIATGGGIVTRPENREVLHRLGYVVWLRAPLHVILNRTRRNNARPLLQTDDPAERVRTLLALREPWYRETSHLQLDTAGLTSREIATGILECARYFFATQQSQPPPCPPQ